jgi:hypothetical protein
MCGIDGILEFFMGLYFRKSILFMCGIDGVLEFFLWVYISENLSILCVALMEF